jgi:hypothetical protein
MIRPALEREQPGEPGVTHGARRAGLASLVLAVCALAAAGCARHEPPHGIEGVVVNDSDVELRDVTFFGQAGPLAPAIGAIAPHDSGRAPLAIAGEDAVFATFLAGGSLHVSADSAAVRFGGSRAVRVLVSPALDARCVAR